MVLLTFPLPSRRLYISAHRQQPTQFQPAASLVPPQLPPIVSRDLQLRPPHASLGWESCHLPRKSTLSLEATNTPLDLTSPNTPLPFSPPGTSSYHPNLHLDPNTPNMQLHTVPPPRNPGPSASLQGPCSCPVTDDETQ